VSEQRLDPVAEQRRLLAGLRRRTAALGYSLDFASDQAIIAALRELVKAVKAGAAASRPGATDPDAEYLP
jgi:hypothetical protein